MISNQKKPLSETNPALVYGLAIFIFVFAVFTAGMLILAPLVDSDSKSSEAVAEDGGPSTPGGPVNATIVANSSDGRTANSMFGFGFPGGTTAATVTLPATQSTFSITGIVTDVTTRAPAEVTRAMRRPAGSTVPAPRPDRSRPARSRLPAVDSAANSERYPRCGRRNPP